MGRSQHQGLRLQRRLQRGNYCLSESAPREETIFRASCQAKAIFLKLVYLDAYLSTRLVGHAGIIREDLASLLAGPGL